MSRTLDAIKSDGGIGLPGALMFPLRDLGGLPAVYVIGVGRGRAARALHVGQAVDVAERCLRYGAMWRKQGLAPAQWCEVWPVNVRALTRTEAAVQTMLLPERDRPKTVRLQRHHVAWLRRLGLEDSDQQALYRSAWRRYCERTGLEGVGMSSPW